VWEVFDRYDDILNSKGKTNMGEASERPSVPTLAEVQNYLRVNRNWGRWGADDERGTANLITDECRVRAAQLIRSGRSISLSRPIDAVPGVDLHLTRLQRPAARRHGRKDHRDDESEYLHASPLWIDEGRGHKAASGTMRAGADTPSIRRSSSVASGRRSGRGGVPVPCLRMHARTPWPHVDTRAGMPSVEESSRSWTKCCSWSVLARWSSWNCSSRST